MGSGGMSNDQAIADLKGGAYAGAPQAAAPVPQVYLGLAGHNPDRGPAAHDDPAYNAAGAFNPGALADNVGTLHARITDVDTASAQFYAWSEDRLKRWEKTLLDNGKIKPGNYDWNTLEAEWGKAVTGASKLLEFGKKRVTPEKYVEMSGIHGIGGSGSLTAGGGTTTNTSTSVNEVDDMDARAAANNAYTSLLGRAANAKESSAIHAALNAYAAAHPSISTTSSTTDGSGNSTQNTHTSGGMGSAAAGQIVDDKAKAAPGYGEYQAATTYMSALQSALGATAQVR